jgi:DNA recombination protein RmuC
LARNAEEIRDLGKQLYKRLGTLADHWNKVGWGLNAAVKAYNSAAKSLEARILVTGRKFEELRAAPLGAEIAQLNPVEATASLIDGSSIGFPPTEEDGRTITATS